MYIYIQVQCEFGKVPLDTIFGVVGKVVNMDDDEV